MNQITPLQVTPSLGEKLHTAEISLKSSETRKILVKVVECWLKVAANRSIDAIVGENKIAYETLQSCRRVLLDILMNCINYEKYDLQKYQAYIAFFPEKMQLEGLAISSSSSSICDLVTHPKNIAISNKDSRVSHVGTALIAHICENMDKAQPKNEEPLNLIPSFCSRGFYKKLGFAPEDDVPEDKWTLTKLILSEKNKAHFMEAHKEVAIKDIETITLEKFASNYEHIS
jgi:hypothetical protein